MKKVDLGSYLLHEGEALAEFTVEGWYSPGLCIIPDDKPVERLDIAGCLEETLHRIIEEKRYADNEAQINHPFYSESEADLIGSILMADQDPGEELDSVEIDLNYRIHGCLTSFERVPHTALHFEKKLYERYKLIWMLDHRITLCDAFAEWRDYCDPANGLDAGTSNEDAFDSWEEDSGFSGRLYPCFDEFVAVEYSQKDDRLFFNTEEEKRWELDQ